MAACQSGDLITEVSGHNRVSGRRYLEMSELCPSIAMEEGLVDYVRDYPPEWYLRSPW